MNWDKTEQLRHAAQYCWRFLLNGQRKNILDLKKELELIGYHGMIESLSSDSIIHGWKEAGWIKISPNGRELRLTEAGIEQFAQWKEADSLWEQGTTETIKLAKRLKAGEPAKNLQKIVQIIGKGILTGVYDPYIDEKALETLQKLKGLGVEISKTLRLLTAPKAGKAAASVASFLRDLNAEISSQWELRAYSGKTRPHRRFLILHDKSIITCGLSLNNIDKDEVLDQIRRGDELAVHDCEFFDNCWVSATPVR